MGIPFPTCTAQPGVRRDLCPTSPGIEGGGATRIDRHLPSPMPPRGPCSRAVGHLWGRLKAPVHCRRFTAIHRHAQAGRKRATTSKQVRVGAGLAPGGHRGPFTVAVFAPVSPFDPEASALVIDTDRAGRTVHSGRLQDRPRTRSVGEPYDETIVGARSGRTGCWPSPGLDQRLLAPSRPPPKAQLHRPPSASDSGPPAAWSWRQLFASNVARAEDAGPTPAFANGRSILP